MKFVPCFCGCERGGHKDNHDCFVSARDSSNKVTTWEPHGLVCEICVSVAQQARQMHNSGASIAAIRDVDRAEVRVDCHEPRHPHADANAQARRHV